MATSNWDEHAARCLKIIEQACAVPFERMSKAADATEPALKEATGSARFMTVPVRYPDIYKMYESLSDASWKTSEINFSEDRKHYLSLEATEQRLVRIVNGFFLIADGLVTENLALTFLTEVMIAEARLFYSFQFAQESVHNDSYSRINEEIVPDAEERERLLEWVNSHPSLMAKQAWAQKWMDKSTKPFAVRLVAFAIVEGIFFSGSFAVLNALRTRGLCPGICTANEWISRDEGQHCSFACLLLSKLASRPEAEEIRQMIAEAVAIEFAFWDEALPVPVFGISVGAMKCFIAMIADSTLDMMGLPAMFKIPANPLPFLDKIAMNGKTNFFEKRVTDYAKPAQDGSDPFAPMDHF